MAKGSKTSAKAMTKMAGKSTPKAPAMPEYKPSLYLDGKQVPKALKDAKPGATVTITGTAKVTSKSERLGGDCSISIELDKMAVVQGKPKKG